MKRTKMLLILVLGMACSQLGVANEVVFQMTTSFSKDKIEYILYSSRLKKTPSWEADDENPPLSIRKALAIGRKCLSDKGENPDKWEVDKISLVPVGSPGRWIYIIEVRPPLLPNSLNGKIEMFSIVVLMDGTALEPHKISGTK